jgi:hypothetical protein
VCIKALTFIIIFSEISSPPLGTYFSPIEDKKSPRFDLKLKYRMPLTAQMYEFFINVKADWTTGNSKCHTQIQILCTTFMQVSIIFVNKL